MHHQQNTIAAKLVDEEGRLKPFAQWAKEVLPIADHYNKNWLQTEYSTAIIRARQASQWRKYERDADLFPNLKWLPSTSVEKREGHIPFYGLVKPIDDPFWKLHYPGNLWNCKCGITNTDDPAHGHTPAAPYKPAPGLDVNPATGQLFNINSHPYKTKAYEGAEKAAENASNGINKELTKRAYRSIKKWRDSIDKFNGFKVESPTLKTGKLTILRRSINDVIEHKADWRDILYISKIEKEVKYWEYSGYEKLKHKKNQAEIMLFYKAKVGNHYRFIEILLHKHYGEVLYCIVPFDEKRELKT